MKTIWYYFILLILIFSCSTSSKKNNPIDYITNDAAVILKIKNLGSLKSNLSNNAFLKELSKNSYYNRLSNKISSLNYLNTEEELFICFYEDSNDSLQFSVITKLTKGLFQIDSLPNHSIETLKYENETITKSSVDNQILYSVIKDSIFIGASSQLILSNSIKSSLLNPNLEMLLNTASKDNQLSILINKRFEKNLNTLFINDAIKTTNFTDYLMLDAIVEQDEILFSGITKATDSVKNLVTVFKNTIPQENLLATITPASSDGFMSLTFNDFKVFEKNLNSFNNTDSLKVQTALFDNIIEVGVIYEADNRAIVLNSLDSYITKEALLNDQDMVETYRDVVIFNFSQPELFQKTFAPFIAFNEASLYCEIDNFFVFANSLDLLQNVISSYKNQTTYATRAYYTNIKEQFSDEASLLCVMDAPQLNTLINNNLKETANLNLSDFNASGIQFIYDSDFAHVNALIQKNKIKAVENSVSEISNIKLETDLLINPQLVTNHVNKEKEIVVQDSNNNLYLISNNGKILWKKQLQGAVLGTIEQIDIFKNGRLQLAFATTNRVYVIDREGKDVTPFPLNFSDAITQPLSVFDYDNNKAYRLLVTQGKNVLMYDTKGKIVKGFTFKNTSDNLVHQPQHIRIGKKDYLLLKTKGKLYILDRTGKTRITTKNNYNYSSEAVYLYNNKFTTTSADGKLITIDTNGNTASQDIGLTDLHDIVTTSKTLVTLSDNKLTIKRKTYELDFGNYSNPNIFYINDKIYVSVTDLQTQKVYLFDSNAKLLNNFPVYGNAAIALDNLKGSKNLGFVTKGDSNSIIIYQIN